MMKLMDITGYYMVDDYARFNGVDRWDGSILITESGYFEGYSTNRVNNEKMFICGWIKGEEISVHQLVDSIDYNFITTKKDGFVYSGMFGERNLTNDDLHYLGECSIVLSNSYKKKSRVVSMVGELKDQLLVHETDMDNYCAVSMNQRRGTYQKSIMYS